MKRMAHLGRVKPGKQQEYIEKHSRIWPEMKEAMRQAGYLNITSFMHGTDLFVYYEVDEETFEREIKNHPNHPEMLKWNQIIKGVYDEEFEIVHFEEAFHFE